MKEYKKPYLSIIDNLKDVLTVSSTDVDLTFDDWVG